MGRIGVYRGKKAGTRVKKIEPFFKLHGCGNPIVAHIIECHVAGGFRVLRYWMVNADPFIPILLATLCCVVYHVLSLQNICRFLISFICCLFSLINFSSHSH